MDLLKRKIRKLVVITPHDRVGLARDLMDSGNFRHLPVVECGRLVGILSYSDLRNLDDSQVVDNAMTRNPVTITPTTTIDQAIRLILELKISALPVVVDAKPIGILSSSDILEGLLHVNRSEVVAVFLSRAVGGPLIS
jgi:CBS domain-containing protein